MSLTGTRVEYYQVNNFGVKSSTETYQFVPSPMMEISRESYTTNDGSVVGGGYNISLEGSLLPSTLSAGIAGHDYADGTTNITKTFEAKNALIKGFSQNGGIFEGEFSFDDASCDSIAFWTSGVIIDSLQFTSPNQWTSRVDYSAEIFCPNTFMTGLGGKSAGAGASGQLESNSDYIAGSFETQSQEFNVDILAKSQQVETTTGTIRTPTWFSVGVSSNTQTMRGIEAIGYNPLALGFSIDRAVNAFLDRSTTGAPAFNPSTPEVGPITGVGTSAIHTQRSLGVDYAGGSTSYTDTYVGTPLDGPSGYLSVGLTTGNAVDTYNIDIESSIESVLVTVTVEGEVQGLEAYDEGGAAVAAANSYLNTIISSTGGITYERALALYNSNPTTSSQLLALNGEPTSKTVGYNTNDGTATYSLNYTNRPANCFSGALSESISISRDNATDVIASLTILGRANGPILQDIGTKTASTTSVTIEAFIIPSSETGACTGDFFIGSPTYYEEVIDGVEGGIADEFETFYRTSDSKSWDPRQGRFTRSVAWTHTDC